MSTHTNHNEHCEVYFCTVTCYKWLPLFEEANAYNAVYRWFEHLKKDGCCVVGYVIMPNHFHVLLYPTHNGTSLNKLVGEGKRFMAYDIVNNLKKFGNTETLNALVREKSIRYFNCHLMRVSVTSEKMVELKLDYMHHNPVSGKWSLVEDFTTYQHSSAAFYELGIVGKVEIVHYKNLGNEEVNTTQTTITDKSV